MLAVGSIFSPPERCEIRFLQILAQKQSDQSSINILVWLQYLLRSTCPALKYQFLKPCFKNDIFWSSLGGGGCPFLAKRWHRQSEKYIQQACGKSPSIIILHRINDHKNNLFILPLHGVLVSDTIYVWVSSNGSVGTTYSFRRGNSSFALVS